LLQQQLLLCIFDNASCNQLLHDLISSSVDCLHPGAGVGLGNVALPFPSPPSSLQHSIISMLTSFTSSLRPSFSLATRALSTSTTARQQPRFSEDGSEQVFRPSNVQSKRMDDVGTRSIFTPEQDMFRESVRKFMQDTLAPQQEAFEKAGEPTREAWKAMGAQGLIGVSTPAEVSLIFQPPPFMVLYTSPHRRSIPSHL